MAGTQLRILLSTGLAHHRAARLAEAARCYRDIVAADPDHADALHLLGLVAHAGGDHPAAVAHLARAARLRPDVAHFHANLGTAQLAAGAPEQAAPSFRAALARDPASADCWHNLGLALLRCDRPADAEPAFRAALAHAPQKSDAHANLGACLHRLGRHAEAAAALRAALALDPKLQPALSSLGLVLAALGEMDAAEAALRDALALRPEAAAHTNLGNLLRARERLDEAETLLREAARLRPDDPDAWHNLAAVLAAAGQHNEAEALCRHALTLHPEHPDANYLLGTLLLADGRKGWAGLEYRWRRRDFSPPRRFAEPRWDGAPLAGRTLLLHAEQGFGDAIQMLRFVPEIAAGGRVLLELPAPLRRLAETVPGARIAAEDAAFDCECPLPSLPFALDLALDRIPSAPYLRAAPADLARWTARLAAVPGPRVGLAWAGNPEYRADRQRSIPPECLAVLADLRGVNFVSLQPGAAAPFAGVVDWAGELADFADTAALIAGLDLVVSVDTAVAHLAGALGQRVWLLNRFDACWRWPRGRADSKWYPAMRVITQARTGDWAGVLAQVRDGLAALAHDGGR